MSITALRIITKPTERVLTLAEAKSHLRVTHSAEDAHILSLVLAASDWAGTYMRRHLVTTIVDLAFDCFPDSGRNYYIGYGAQSVHFDHVTVANRVMNKTSRDRGIFLPGGNVTAVESISYIDEAGVPQTLSGPTSTVPGTDYQEDLTDDEWPMILPPIDLGWPSTQGGGVNVVAVRYTAGWAKADIPESIRHAVRFKLADLYTVRAPSNQKTAGVRAAEDLLDPFVVTLM